MVKTYMHARLDNTQISVSQHALQVRMFHLFLLHPIDFSIASSQYTLALVALVRDGQRSLSQGTGLAEMIF